MFGLKIKLKLSMKPLKHPFDSTSPCVAITDMSRHLLYNRVAFSQHANSLPDVRFKTTGCEREHPESIVRLSSGRSYSLISWMDGPLTDSDVLKMCIKDSIIMQGSTISLYKRLSCSGICSCMHPEFTLF